VQEYAHLLLMNLEERDKGEAFRNQMRRDVATMGPVTYVKMFPEYAPPEATELSEDELEAALDNTGDNQGPVRYESGDEIMTPEKMQELLARLAADAETGSISGTDVTYGEWV
jgi:hypothetical protein